MADVALVAMPFGPLFYPSLSLSVLKPALTRRGFSSALHYFLIDYAEAVGLRFYSGIANSRGVSLGKLAGEWIFSGELFDSTEADVQEYVAKVLRMRRTGIRRAPRPVAESVIQRVLKERARAAVFLDQYLETTLAGKPRIVGFTSTFQQHCASLALARRIKAASPETFIVMGGPNCEGVMGAETVRQFPFIDAAVSGEADLILPEIVRRVLQGESVDGLLGVRTQAGVQREFAADRFDNTATVMDLDELPEPDYDDYVERFRRTRFSRDWHPPLLFETSRGCWWGERMHCTFCGLNGQTMKYRSKSPGRAISELQSLMARYPGFDLDVTDNILDLGYFDTVLPELAKLDINIELFYETKSNLKKEQVRLLRDARIERIQPGIESLSDSVLKLMRKGVSALQNIQLLKWCKEIGVNVQWNLLCGFPGESPEDYERMTRMVPLLTHLPPAEHFIPIRLDRFSPNFFDAERLGFANVRPFDAYSHVYRFAPEAVHNMACFFRFDYAGPQDPDQYAPPLSRAVDEWKSVHDQSDLFSIDTGDHLIIWDLRPIARELLTVLSGIERRIYLSADAVTHIRQLASSLGAGEETIEQAVERLISRHLMLRDGDRVLSLAIPLGEYSPARPVVRRFRRAVRAVGERSNGGIAIPCSITSPRAAERLHRALRSTEKSGTVTKHLYVKLIDSAEQRRRSGRGAHALTPSRFAVDGNYVVLT